MRIVGTLSHENQARKLSSYLKAQSIANSCEVNFDPATNQMTYQIWIHDEDQIDKAKTIFDEFEKNGSDPKYEAFIEEPPPLQALEDPPQQEPRRYKNYLTSFFLAVCVFIFVLNAMELAGLRAQGISKDQILLTPIQEKLMYDVPEELEEQAPFWKGAYFWIIAKIQKQDPSLGEGPLFTKILQGQVWRLVSPAFLHVDLLHILFNMLWLWVLGRPIEQRIGPFRLFVLTMCAAVVTNTLQYLMSGPFFIGYSGVITTMAGFTWMREKIAPWEGYPLTKGTILFLLIFILSIFCIQVAAFFIQIFTAYNFAPNIANTAHIAGALLGAFLGRYKYFAQRVIV
jgi:GlpG protein